MAVQAGPKAFVKELLGRAPGQFEDKSCVSASTT